MVQVSSHDDGPCICIWDSSPAAADGSPALPELARIQLGKGKSQRAAVLSFWAPSAWPAAARQ
jgi:hypothetical protein